MTQLRSSCANKAFGWMPHWPPACAPEDKSLVPPGPAFLETELNNGVGASTAEGECSSRLPGAGYVGSKTCVADLQ